MICHEGAKVFKAHHPPEFDGLLSSLEPVSVLHIRKIASLAFKMSTLFASLLSLGITLTITGYKKNINFCF